MLYFEKIKQLRTGKGLTQRDMAEYLSISQQAYANYENGRRKIDFETALKIGEKLDVSLDELGMDYRHPAQSNIDAIYTDHIRMIPVYNSVSAGFGAYADDCIVDYLPIRIVSDTDAENTILIRVRGNSMYPKIEDGDIVQVLRCGTVDDGDIAVILDGDDGLVKKIQFGPDFIELHSINPEYPPRRYEREEMNTLRIVGKVQGVFKPI